MKTHVPYYIFCGALAFSFFIFVPFDSNGQNIDFGKSYINVTKGLNGGTVEPGDTLEIRACIVVKSGTYDSCAYFDVVPAGTTYIPGTIRALTNEGKIYKQFTDAVNDDDGWISGTSIQINLGFSGAAAATAFRRGRIVNTNKPSFYGGTCILTASFRVKVTAAYNTSISMGGGSMSYKPSPGFITSFTFPGRSVMVYPNYGICANTIGTNAIGTEFNGTFGTGKPRNRGVSANVPVGYTYNTFTTNTPNDYYYGVANNTSINTGYTTLNTWPKPDNAHRVFGVWDIIGDHTGAVSPLLGNPAADTVANPNAGYMLVINAAYRIDSAFQQTISGLCPNTYYEISCWLRNICSKCGCDSNGTGASGAGYIPTALNDSSGVYPNLSFGVDGFDYYTTGNILYSGNWIKKGFTFLTGVNQTSFTLKFFNNAPGGGGNDWALDDISVATCSPNLSFTPNNNPTICVGNVVSVGAYVRSFFNNYTYFKWQKSINNGVTWTNTATSGTGSPTWNGSAWEYYTAYPSFVSTMADSGTKFKVVVATTAPNLANANCSFSDVTSILTLNIIDCGIPLQTNFISFSGKLDNDKTRLNWTTDEEDGAVSYIIQRSADGINFYDIDSLNGNLSKTDVNYYKYTDEGKQLLFYRIRMVAGTHEKISRIVKISSANAQSSFTKVINPFSEKVSATLFIPEAQTITVQLLNTFGNVVKEKQYAVNEGENTLVMDQTKPFANGMYILNIKTNKGVLACKIIKE